MTLRTRVDKLAGRVGRSKARDGFQYTPDDWTDEELEVYTYSEDPGPALRRKGLLTDWGDEPTPEAELSQLQAEMAAKEGGEGIAQTAGQAPPEPAAQGIQARLARARADIRAATGGPGAGGDSDPVAGPG